MNFLFYGKFLILKSASSNFVQSWSYYNNILIAAVFKVFYENDTFDLHK